MSYARSAVTRMTLDMSRPDLQRSETVTLGDTNRRWEVTLINGGAPFRLPPNWTAALTGTKPDGTGLLNGCSVADGKIIYDFASGAEIATCAGNYPVQFDIWDEVGDLVASPKIYVNVLDDVRPHAELDSNGQYTLIGDLIGRVNQTEADVDLLGETARAQGGDIAALKEKITTAGSVTIPASEWKDETPTSASFVIPFVKMGQIGLLIPANDATKQAAIAARLSAYPVPIIGADAMTAYIVRAAAETAPTVDMTFLYVIMTTDNTAVVPVVALIGVDAYGEGGGGTASGVDEAAVKEIINTLLGNVANERQYSADNPPPYPVTTVNGKTGAVNLNATDVGARPSTWTPTAADVKADPAGTAQTLVDDLARKTAQDLANYYTKAQTLTKDEINTLVSAIPKFKIEVVTSLPTSNISETTVYLVKSGADSTNLYTEYIRANGAWERLGTQTVDLTGYATEAWVNELIAAYVKTADMEAYVAGLLKSYITKEEADETYQPAGDYLTPTTGDQRYAKPSDIPTVPQTLPNPYALNLLGKTYNGESAVSLTIDELIEAIKAASGGVVAWIGDDNNIYVSGNLTDGTYTAYYEVDGEYIEIGELTLGEEETPEPEPTTYTVTFVADGVTVDAVEYQEGDTALERVPDVPAKEGYTGMWEAYDITNGGNITVNAVYTQITVTPTYTNLFTAETALLNTRIAGTGELKTDENATGKVTTDFITIPTEKLPFSASTKIYIKGATFTADGNTKLATYQAATGTDYSAMYSSLNGSSITTVDEGNGVISVSGIANSFPATVKRMALTLKVKDTEITADDVAGIIITIGEPITDTDEPETITETLTLLQDTSLSGTNFDADRTGTTGYCATPSIDLTSIPKPCVVNLTGACWALETYASSYIRFSILDTSGQKLAGDYTHKDKMPSGVSMVYNTENRQSVTVTISSENVGKIRFAGCYGVSGNNSGTNNFADAKATLTYTPAS